jgi:hypothetical protein
MSSTGPSEENPLADTVNPYMRELKMHPKELLLKDGELQIKDVQVPKGEGNLKARMEALEQEVFRDFYFRALRSLVVLSFPQLLSFSSVFPKPLSETLRRSSNGRIPV